MSQHRITYVTAPAEVAEQIATTLVDIDLAVCINIIEKVGSIYKWEGRVEKSQESLLIIKTTTEKTDQVIAKIKEIHPYEVPEAISFDITAGNQEYLDWLSGKEIAVDDSYIDDEGESETEEAEVED